MGGITMKKYWKLLVISLVIVTTIGSYYVLRATANKNDMSFTFEMTNGNEKEIDNLVLEATYQSNHTSHWLQISNDSAIDSKRQSFIGNLMSAPSYEPLNIQRYIQEYRNFMRGKERVLNNYFEDETRLIYVNLPNEEVLKGNPITLKIDILDKETKDHASFKINTPAETNYNFINVRDVYVDKGKIKILAANYLTSGGEEFHIYTVDENNRVLEDDSIIAESGSGRTSIRVFRDGSNKVQNENYYLYAVDKYANHKETGETTFLSSKMYVYQNSTSEVEELVIPTELKLFKDSIVIDDEDIFIPIYSANGIEMNRYNMEKKQWEAPLNFNYPSVTKVGNEPFLKLLDGKLYFVNLVSGVHTLFIGDLQTGETLYEGKIIREGGEKQDKAYSLYIHQVDIVE